MTSNDEVDLLKQKKIRSVKESKSRGKGEGSKRDDLRKLSPTKFLPEEKGGSSGGRGGEVVWWCVVLGWAVCSFKVYAVFTQDAMVTWRGTLR